MTDRPSPNVAAATAPDPLRRVRDSFSRQGLVGTLGAWLVDLEMGRAAIEIPFGNRVAGQSGRFHSAVVAGIAQSSGGCAAATLAPAGTMLAADAIQMRFTGPTDGDLLRADASAVANGKNGWTVTVEVKCLRQGQFTPCASGMLDFVVRGPSA